MRQYIKTNELCHHGIKGQKWGVRRFQNKDGGLTLAGKKRYSKEKGVNDVRAKKHKRLKDADRQQQMKALAERKDIRRKDRKIAEYGSKSRSARMAGEIAKAGVKAAIQDARAKRNDVPEAYRKRMAQQATQKAVAEFVKKESKLRKLSESYNPDGTGKKNHMPAIQRAATRVGVFAATATYAVARQRTVANKAATEKRMKDWGDNILAAKYDSIVPVSESEYRVKD